MADGNQLTMFDGQEVVTATLGLAGTITHVTALPARELPHGQVVLLVVADVKHVGFDRCALGLVRTQKAKITEAYELAAVLDERQVAQLLSTLQVRTHEAVAARVSLSTPALDPAVEDLELAALEQEMSG